MLKHLFVAAVMVTLIGVAGPARALTVDVGLGLNSGDLTYGSGGTLNGNIDLLALGPNLTMNNSAILPAGFSVTNFFLSPTGTSYKNLYLGVLGGGSATFTLASSQNVFGFTWGTIDNWNSLSITDSRNVTYTITGTDILTNFGLVDHSGQADVIFNDPFGSITSVELLSSQNTFEASNFSQGSTVPLPASFSLFAVGLAGLLLLGWRNRRDEAS